MCPVLIASEEVMRLHSNYCRRDICSPKNPTIEKTSCQTEKAGLSLLEEPSGLENTVFHTAWKIHKLTVDYQED